jgi:hypothetical protein
MSGANNKASTLIGGRFNGGEFELVALYLKAGENVGWKVMRKVNQVGKLDNY